MGMGSVNLKPGCPNHHAGIPAFVYFPAELLVGTKKILRFSFW
jgi:hypothetical protein